MAIATQPLTPFGVEVDRDLSRMTLPEDNAAIRALFDSEKLLRFRGQNLSDQDQIRVMSWLGAVLPPEREHRELSLDGAFGSGRIGFHSDLLFTVAPYERNSLYGLEVEDDQTSTYFVSCSRAAAALPAALRARVEGLDALHSVPLVQAQREIAYDPPAGVTRTRAPVIRRHPRTGEALLQVSEIQTARIEGLNEQESESLLRELFEYLYAPENIFEHVWRGGDLLVWDNLALQHCRNDQSARKVRRLRRVIGAEQSFFELCPEFPRADMITYPADTAAAG